MVAPSRPPASIVGAVKIGRFALYVLRERRWPLGVAAAPVLLGGALCVVVPVAGLGEATRV